MGNFFPRWTNWMPLKLAVCLGFVVVGVTAGMTYYFTPKYDRVGYQPTQPVPFSHKQHVGELGLDCRYCHSYVEVSSHSNVPTNQTCFNCHGPDKLQVKKESEKLAQVRHANDSDTPINWIKVHKAPDYVYFNHSVHVNRGISCVSCHGQINEMEVVHHDKPHSMGWCLDCHRNAENALRPLDQVTNLTYKPEQLSKEAFYAKLGMKPSDDSKVLTQQEVGKALKEKWKIHPPEDCTACHR